jgi:cbb3-type cytochrome oxidase subunit 1
LWFVAAAVVWLPVLYVVGNLPGLSALATALGDVVFTAGFVNVWAVGLVTALSYYIVPKASGQPLANRQLARVGFWSLLFAAIWMGPVQMVAGPAPEWLQAVGEVLGLALPVAAVANATNLALTIGPLWREIGDRPVLLGAITGTGLISLGSILAALASFRSAALLVGFTIYWEGILYLLIGGVALSFAAFAWQAIPNLVGRGLHSATRAVRLVKRTALATLAAGISFVLAGLASGLAWTGAGFTGAFPNVGAGWSESSGLSGVLIGLGVFFVLLVTLGQVGLALSIYRSLASGRATVQEILVVTADHTASWTVRTGGEDE